METTSKAIPERLPCFPCPHKATCCAWGADLTPDEAALIVSVHGEDKVVYVQPPGEPKPGHRTAVIPGWGCAFLGEDFGCKIHSRPEYPRVCAGFPHLDDTGAPYSDDVTICPEILIARVREDDAATLDRVGPVRRRRPRGLAGPLA